MTIKFKGDTLTQRKCINNLLRFYAIASHLEAQEGMDWYKEANMYAKELSSRFGYSLSQIAGIIAAFSPQAAWTENKRYAISWLINPKSQVRSEVQTDKVRRIIKLKTEDKIYEALSITGRAFKTKAFFLNILNWDTITDVTIDRHAIAACLQYPDKVEALSTVYSRLTKPQYIFFEKCYVKLAGELGIMPHQLQAIIWTVYRRCRDLRQYSTTDASQWQPFLTEDF